MTSQKEEISVMMEKLEELGLAMARTDEKIDTLTYNVKSINEKMDKNHERCLDRHKVIDADIIELKVHSNDMRGSWSNVTGIILSAITAVITCIIALFIEKK